LRLFNTTYIPRGPNQEEAIEYSINRSEVDLASDKTVLNCYKQARDKQEIGIEYKVYTFVLLEYITNHRPSVKNNHPEEFV
jgi:hypothetical protein